MIHPKSDFLSKKLSSMSGDYLFKLFYEISQFKETGIIEHGEFTALSKEVSEVFSGEKSLSKFYNLVENAVLFEISRRFYNQSI